MGLASNLTRNSIVFGPGGSPPMRIHQLSADEALASLKSNPHGLSSPEALRRLAEYGPNRVEEVAGEPMFLRFLKEFTHFFALILWLAAALAFLAEWSDPARGMAKVGYAIVAVILVSGLFSFWQEFRVERTLAALRDLLPQQVDVLREGRAVRLLADQLVPGEIVLLEQGDNIPADCRLIEAFGVRVNDATITGESVSKLRMAEPSVVAEMIQAENIVLAGTAGGRPHTGISADDHDRHVGQRRGADVAPEGDRQTSGLDPELRQHRRAVQRQDRDTYRRRDDL